jgi:DNA-binding beta-propeller fold protein YncE
MRKNSPGSQSYALRKLSRVTLTIILMSVIGAYSVSAGEESPSPPLGPALWVATRGDFVAEFAGKQLASGMQNPSRQLDSADLDEPWGLIFDSSKDLWVSNVGNGKLTKFTLEQLMSLKTNDAPSPEVVISGLDRPEGMAFDSEGDLWVANEATAELLEFTSSQLSTSGSPSPHVVSSSALESPVGIAFDSSENLWVADDGFSEISMFSKAQLMAGGSQTPTVVLSSDNDQSLDSCEPILFDSIGNLWAANNEGSIVKFGPNQLTTSGSPTPALMLTATSVKNTSVPSLDDPTGITFDTKGNLWVGNADSDNDGSIAKFSKKSLKKNGSPQPSVFIDSNSGHTNLAEPFFVIFGPKVP